VILIIFVKIMCIKSIKIILGIINNFNFKNKITKIT